jgi:hypothetical protein
MAGVYGNKVVTDGLVCYIDAANIKSYPGSGTTCVDLTSNGNNGTLTNGPTFDSANGGSIVFDGVNDSINFNDNDGLDGFSEYTLSAWVYINSFATYNAIFHKWGWGGYAYFLGIWDGFGLNKQIFVGENYGVDTGGEVGNYGVVSNSSLSTGIWYNITYTSTTAHRKCYINGTLDKSDVNDWRGGNIINSGYDLNIGTHADAPEYTNCKISNITIYNRALSDDEVLQNYNAIKNRFI